MELEIFSPLSDGFFMEIAELKSAGTYRYK